MIRSYEHDLPCLRVVTPAAGAVVYVAGAHVAHWQPAGHEPVLWVSRAAVYREGKAIRGGVPICFPWFGAHKQRAELPAHGFARTRAWSYLGSRAQGDGVCLSFELTADETTLAVYPHPFVARYDVSVGAELELALSVENTGSTPLTFEAALHTYFAVSDVRSVRVGGLSGAEYEDQVLAFARSTQNEEQLGFAAETDRTYTSRAPTVLHDAAAGRRIHVDKTNSATTVVWNPWSARAAQLSDMADDEWRSMLCIETANARACAVALDAGQVHRMTARLRCERASTY